MHVVYPMTKPRSILLDGRVRTTLSWLTYSVVDLRNKQESTDMWRATRQWISFIIDDDAKILKKATYFCL